MKKRIATLYKTDGSVMKVSPIGNKFTLAELQGFVGGYIELVPCRGTVYCNEEGRLRGLPINEKATTQAALRGFSSVILVGDVLFC